MFKLLRSPIFLLSVCCSVTLIIVVPGFKTDNNIIKPITKAAPGWVDLLDKDLSQWGMYLAYSHKSDYTGKQPVDDTGKPIAPVGYNKNEKNVFTVVQEQGEPVLHVSGEIYGCVFTKQDYENFHLKLKVRWGANMFGPRVGKLKDSGILYFSQGEAGADYWRAWMLSQEFQIMQGHMGDYWNIANSAADIRCLSARRQNEQYRRPFAALPAFGTGSDEGLCLRNQNYEKPTGEWNTIELVCFQGKSLHIVNGHVVMVLQNSRYVVNGKPLPLTKGKIQLQSEGCEVYFKNIQIQNITAMPDEYKAYYN